MLTGRENSEKAHGIKWLACSQIAYNGKGTQDSLYPRLSLFLDKSVLEKPCATCVNSMMLFQVPMH